ncbi:MAG: hypothetical protein KDJ99_22650 [Candidatus Competibacteraceae bacterium]|nr:hypothetical protein [Candidatus Competibacteraceae bacterium]
MSALQLKRRIHRLEITATTNTKSTWRLDLLSDDELRQLRHLLSRQEEHGGQFTAWEWAEVERLSLRAIAR